MATLLGTRCSGCASHRCAARLHGEPGFGEIVDLSRVARDLGTRGRRRSTVIRSILEARGDDFVAPASVLEHEFVDLITSSGLSQPDRQVDLGDADGWIGCVDFVYREHRIVIETDGKEHHTALLDRTADAERDRRLTAAGWQVVRLTWFDIVHRPRWTLDRLRSLMQTSTADL